MGKIHSIESMGLVDGPGIRSVVFFQGCKLRCAFCHNPDTWNTDCGTSISPEDLLKKLIRFKPYYSRSNGGVTFSGGEPLLQPEFLLDCLKLCKENGISTCIDTAGVGFGEYDEILKYTDLVLLDIKHIQEIEYKKLVSHNMDSFFIFLNALKRNNSKIWIRHVIIPGITDSIEHIKELANFIKDKNIKNIEKIEFLPYHLLGVNKYELLGIKYRLDGVKAMDKNKCNELYDIFIKELKI